jgi:hypothetical protein
MVPFKGRLGFRQYLPLKPTKWRIKLWSHCESSTAYMYNFQVYTGKENGQEKGLTFRVVAESCTCLYLKFAKVYFDNFYTSIDILRHLFTHGVYACGTVRANRKGLAVNLLKSNL